MMYKPLRSALRSLLREFRRASSVYPALFHETLSPWSTEVLSKKTWEAFIAAQQQPSGWQMFDVFPDLKSCGRFFGGEAGLEEFKRLGESLHLVCCEIDASLDREAGYYGLLNVLYDMAGGFPTPLLRLKAGLWKREFEPAAGEGVDLNKAHSEWFEKNAVSWTRPDNGGEPYPTSPYCLSLCQNVFTSAIGALQMILAPEDALLVGDQIGDIPFALFRQPGSDSEKVVQETPPSETSEMPAHQFQLSGGVWLARFINEVGYFPDQEGMRHIAQLLANPEKELEAMELQGLKDSPVVNEIMTPQLGLDKEARQALEKKIIDLDQEIAQKEKSGDPNRVSELQKEKQQFVEYLKEWRNRRLGTPSPREKARKAVGNAIRRAKDKIKPSMPEFARFLDRSILPNGSAFTYSPSQPVPQWVL